MTELKGSVFPTSTTTLPTGGSQHYFGVRVWKLPCCPTLPGQWCSLIQWLRTCNRLCFFSSTYSMRPCIDSKMVCTQLLSTCPSRKEHIENPEKREPWNLKGDSKNLQFVTFKASCASELRWWQRSSLAQSARLPLGAEADTSERKLFVTLLSVQRCCC